MALLAHSPEGLRMEEADRLEHLVIVDNPLVIKDGQKHVIYSRSLLDNSLHGPDVVFADHTPAGELDVHGHIKSGDIFTSPDTGIDYHSYKSSFNPQ